MPPVGARRAGAEHEAEQRGAPAGQRRPKPWRELAGKHVPRQVGLAEGHHVSARVHVGREVVAEVPSEAKIIWQP